LDERWESFFIGCKNSKKFIILSQVPEQTGEITIPRNDESLIVPVVVNHSLENKLRVDISFYFPWFHCENFFENHDKSGFLEHKIEILISEHKAEKYVSDFHSRFFSQIFTKTLPVNLPTKFIKSGIEVLCIDERIVLLHRFFLLKSSYYYRPFSQNVK